MIFLSAFSPFAFDWGKYLLFSETSISSLQFCPPLLALFLFVFSFIDVSSVVPIHFCLADATRVISIV